MFFYHLMSHHDFRGVCFSMIVSSRHVKISAYCLAIAVFVGSAGLVGCQPEGVGTMKPPEGKRPPDSSLGRPFGNAPELPKKKSAKNAPSEEQINKGIQNPRL